jgi:hypothetical protein
MSGTSLTRRLLHAAGALPPARGEWKTGRGRFLA